MTTTKGRVKTILIDKAPSGDNLSMQQNLGFSSGNYQPLADALNAEFGTTVGPADIENLSTVNDLVAYMESIVP